MKKSLSILAGVAMVAVGLGRASAAVITFDDLSGAAVAIPAGYQGFNWSNFFTLNGVNNDAGYLAGVVSASNVAFTAGSPAIISSSTAFTFNSGYFTAGLNNGLQVGVTGYNGATLEFSKSFTVNTTGPTLETFNWSNITSVDFNTSGGTPLSETQFGEQLVADNLTVNAAIPEPASFIIWSLLGTLAIGLGWWGRRRAVRAAA